MSCNDRRTTAAPGLLDVLDLAARLGVTERFIRRLVHERRIPFYKVGHLVRFDAADVDQWLARGRVEPAMNHTLRHGRR